MYIMFSSFSLNAWIYYFLFVLFVLLYYVAVDSLYVCEE